MLRRIGWSVLLGFAILLRPLLSYAESAPHAIEIYASESPTPLADLASDMRSRVMSKKSKRVVMCSTISELPTTMLCFFKTKPGMHAALGRITEKLETKRPLLTDREHTANPSKLTIEGHDLRVMDIGQVLYEHDIARERLSMDAAPEGSEWMIELERDFGLRYLIPLVVQAKHDVLVALVAESDDAVLGHEVLHATFFTMQSYQNAVRVFWQGLSAKHRAEIKARLATIPYDINDEALVLNEVQAYLLMPGAKDELLGEWQHLARPLLRVMYANGIAPPWGSGPN
jgi:hypothetical protein